MAVEYTGTTIGTLTLCQAERVRTDEGKYVEKKDERGRTVYNRYPIQIRYGNCMAIFIRVYKEENPKDPERCWVHSLQSFIIDEQHLKNTVSKRKKDVFEYILGGKLRNIKLNIYYKDMQTLAKYMARDGLKVTCYYKEPRKE